MSVCWKCWAMLKDNLQRSFFFGRKPSKIRLKRYFGCGMWDYHRKMAKILAPLRRTQSNYIIQFHLPAIFKFFCNFVQTTNIIWKTNFLRLSESLNGSVQETRRLKFYKIAIFNFRNDIALLSNTEYIGLIYSHAVFYLRQTQTKTFIHFLSSNFNYK